LRGVIAFGAAVALMLALAAGAAAAPRAFVANYEDESISVVDTQSGQTVGEPIELTGQPRSVAIVPGREALVTQCSGDTVTAISTQTFATTPIEVGECPENLAVAPDGKTAYVTESGSEEIGVIDTTTNTQTGSIPVGVSRPSFSTVTWAVSPVMVSASTWPEPLAATNSLWFAARMPSGPLTGASIQISTGRPGLPEASNGMR